MKINLTKLGKIQGEFRLGNIGNFTALEIKKNKYFFSKKCWHLFYYVVY